MQPKKVVSDSLGLVNFVIRLVNSVLDFPFCKRNFLENSNYRKPVINPREILNKCLYGEALPEVQPLNPFIFYHFSRKRYPFCIPSIDKWYPYHIPCLELCIPFTCCKCTVFLIGITHKNKTFSRRFKAIKSIC